MQTPDYPIVEEMVLIGFLTQNILSDLYSMT